MADSSRLPELDALRGIFLLWMTLTHLPTHVSAVSNQAVGYVSSAEGFIFLAALFTGQVQQHLRNRYGPSFALRKLFGRVSRIYRYHLGLLAFAFTVAAAAAVDLHRVPLQNLLDFYLRDPKTAIGGAMVLLYNPPLFDILPIYIVFMLATPLLLAAFEKLGWVPVVSASGIVWLLAQFHLREWLVAVATRHGFPIPLNETGAFDLFAWQFLWTAGLLLGASGAIHRWSRRPVPRWLYRLSIAAAAILFVCRHAHLELLTGPQLFGVLVDKWKLGILRWFDAAALGVILLRFGPGLARAPIVQTFAPLGRHSLEVFSAHILFCVLALGLGPSGWWQELLIVCTAIAGIFAVARLAAPRPSLSPSPASRSSDPAHRSRRVPGSAEAA